MPSYEELLDAALLASSKGKVAEKAALEDLIAAYPNQPAGHALMALQTLWRGDLEEAQQFAAKLGDHPEELAVKGEVMGYGGDVPGAKRLLESALAAAPDDPIVLRCCYSIFGMDEPERAMALARHRVEVRPHDSAGYASVGTVLLNRSVSEAEAYAANPPTAYANSHQHWTLRARLAMKRHDLIEAERHAREAVAACSDSDTAWATLADILKHQGKKTESAEAARFALSLNRRNPLAMRALSAEAASRGDRPEAERWEREAATAVPALAFMQGLQVANKLAKQGKPEAALAELQKLANIAGSTRHAVRTMRMQLFLGMKDDQGLIDEAEAMKRDGVEGILLERAWAEIDRRAGRKNEARARLGSLWQNERSGEVAAPLISLLAEMGEADAVREIAAEATVQVPGLPADAGLVFIALDSAGFKEEARSLLVAAQRQFPNAQQLELLRVGTLAQDGNMTGAMHAMRGLGPEYRPVIRLRFRHVLKLLWRLAVRRKK